MPTPFGLVKGCLLFCGAMAATTAFAAETVAVTAMPRDHGVVIHATATLQASYDVIWRTLTDYDRFSEFIPGMSHSRILERHGATLVVEQVGAAGVSIFRYPINVVVESVEYPPTAITVKLISGNLRRLTGGYTLIPVPNRPNVFTLNWDGFIEPDIDIPSFIAMPVLKSNIEDQFVAMVQEIEYQARSRVVDLAEKHIIPASPHTDTVPVSGRDCGPAASWTRSSGVDSGRRGCARPASEGSLDESPSRLEDINP
jgi:ribosome-associated toxin RatA of RatAB toxin-antitoxin module